MGSGESRDNRVRRWSEVGVVQNIEHLGAELQFYRFMDGKVPMDRQIPLGVSESTQGIP